MSRNIKVGIFLLLGLVVAGVLIFLVGDERHMFQRHATLQATFHDVAGLKVGSPVRMGGLDVGQVETITFGNTDSDRLIHVHFTMIGEQLQRVRSDSRVSIASKGLLGDKALDVTMGTAAGRALANGATVVSEESDDMAGALRSASQAVVRVNSVLENISHVTATLASPQTTADLQSALHDLSMITHQLAAGPGAAHDVLTSDAMARQLYATLASVQSTASHAASTMDHVDGLAREARTGNGLVHALLYDRQGAAMVRTLAGAAEEVGAITRDVRTGNGGLHQVIYGTDLSQTLANINQVTSQTNALMTDIRAGRGTIGALLVDPSLYEDIKTLVGNVQRNEVLRALVRYSIHQDEGARPAVAATPAPAGANQRTVPRPAARPLGAAARPAAPRAPALAP
jgi:phospholipid/cholesterol/gamma-HCH transport system substrate-binding protein